jgi:hypothetical protein
MDCFISQHTEFRKFAPTMFLIVGIDHGIMAILEITRYFIASPQTLRLLPLGICSLICPLLP